MILADLSISPFPDCLLAEFPSDRSPANRLCDYMIRYRLYDYFTLHIRMTPVILIDPFLPFLSPSPPYRLPMQHVQMHPFIAPLVLLPYPRIL